MQYLVPFSALKNTVRIVSLKGQLKVDMSYDEFLDVVRSFLRAVAVDEQWYRATYPDVQEAIDAGTYRDAKQHFIANGYLEGRRPFPLQVDEAWYVGAYPDVKEGIDSGVFQSAHEHFAQHGYAEGRRPAAL